MQNTEKNKTGAAKQIDYLVKPEWDNFNPIYLPYINEVDAKGTEIFYGGSSSGKSNFIAHRAVLDVLSGGHNYLCVRKLGNTLTKSVLNELQKAIIGMGVADLFRIVPSQGHITCVNDFQFLFSGMDDAEKVKSITPKQGVITDIWYEEATEGTYEDIKQLRKRLRGIAKYFDKEVVKRIILSFNPIYKTHWLVKEFFIKNDWQDDQTIFESDDLRILKTTYTDNLFLTEQDRKTLEDEEDEYWYQVYTLGNWGVLGDVILKNWKTEDLSNRIHEFTDIRNGLDFGYSNDPAAYVRVHYDRMRKRIYVFKGFHETELTNPELAGRLKPLVGDEVIFCDCAEPKSIKELQDNGISAKPVKKGKDSVLFSIQWLRQHEIIIDSSLQGMVNELNTWEWKKDKNGDSTTIPVDKNNHYIDALRYALEIEYMGLKGLDLA